MEETKPCLAPNKEVIKFCYKTDTDIDIVFIYINLMKIIYNGRFIMRAVIKRLTYEDKFDRRYCCYWKRGGRKIKRINRRKFRRVIKTKTKESFIMENYL